MDNTIQNLVAGLSQLNLSQNDHREQAYTQIATLISDATRQVRKGTSYKAPKPQLFHGGRNALATRDWLEEIERYCRNTDLPEPEWTSAAIDHLRGTALTWYRMTNLPETTPWSAFKVAFTKEFKPSNHEHSVLMELRELKQASVNDISSYINRFRDLALQLNNPADDMLREYFISGLVSQTQLQVQIADPSSWQDAVKVAERVNGVFARASAKNKPVYVPTQPPTSDRSIPASSGPEPMDLDTLKVLLANFSTTMANIRHPQNSKNRRAALPKLTKAERERCIREGRCFRCRNRGHMAEDCNGMAMHNLETEEETPAGSGNE